MNRFLCSTIATALMILPAAAADMARPMPVKAPVVAPPLWAGWYVGVHGGYAKEDPTATFDPAAFGSSVPGTIVINGATAPFSLSVQPEGGFGGFQIGYNWQTGNLVYGFEADVSFGRIKDTANRPFFVDMSIGGDDGDFTGNFFLERKIDYFGTLRGRFGWAFDSLLLFADGGFAWGHVKTTMGVNNVVADPTNFPAGFPAALNRSVSSSDMQYGFAVGGGIEWMFIRNWSLRGEYLFIDLVSGGTNLSFPGASFTDTDVKMHLGRIAVNYKFAP